MLDRLSLSLVSLPQSAYDLVLVLTDADRTRRESKKLLSREVFNRIATALKPGGRLQAQDGAYATSDDCERREAIFAGLVIDGDDMVKPLHQDTQSVPLRFGKNKDAKATTSAAGTGAVTLNIHGKRTNGTSKNTRSAGVSFVNFSGDYSSSEVNGEDSDDELVDENTLLDEEDMKRPIAQRKPLHLSSDMSFFVRHDSNTVFSP